MKYLPLSALRAFDQVAEHLSFTRAADALNVTQSAVSQQVRQLEERVGRTLVERSGRNVRLTSHGGELADACRRSFSTLETAMHRVSRHQQGGLKVRLPPTFAMKWLMPRLTQFQMSYPDFELLISTSVEPVDFEREDVDIGMQRTSQPDPALHAIAVLEERGLLVGAPQVWGRRKPRLSDIESMTLLSSINRVDDWSSWCVAMNQPNLRPARKIQFSFSLLMYQAALEGAGVCIAQPEFVEEDLVAGRLVAPFNGIATMGRWHYLVCPDRVRNDPAVAQFFSWVRKSNIKPKTAR